MTPLLSSITHLQPTTKYTTPYHFINLCRVILFNVTQDANVFVFHKVDCHTLAAKATRAANAVNVELTIVGQVIIDDQGYLLFFCV